MNFNMRYSTENVAIIALRVALGFIFLWAFVDKLFGLRFSTAAENAIIYGNSPTAGFLSTATYGPFAFIFQSIAGNIIIDILFMASLFIIGITLMSGFGVKYGSFIGAILMFLIWISRFPPKTNPIIDEHVIYILIFIYLLIKDKNKERK